MSSGLRIGTFGVDVPGAVARVADAVPLVRDAARSRNLDVLRALAGPAWRGLVEQRGRSQRCTELPANHDASFDWSYLRDRPALARLYEAAKSSQWNASDLPWKTDVDPLSTEVPLAPMEFLPVWKLDAFRRLDARTQAVHRKDLIAWLLSQFLHGEQGALAAACQVTEAVPWLDAKLYGSTQVVDEGRHVEAFHGYLTKKLEKRYEVNDNLYVVIDALMTDARWDLKFLGMQIMIEGLALGAFGMLRQLTKEPLLHALLTQVITDEARHVHFGVLALTEVVKELSDRERREREDWAFEVSLFLRNRFFAHEFYDEHWAHRLPRRAWDELVLQSEMMALFRKTMFRRVIPNLKRIGLLSERVRPRYQELELLGFEHGRAAPELSAKDLLEDQD